MNKPHHSKHTSFAKENKGLIAAAVVVIIILALIAFRVLSGVDSTTPFQKSSYVAQIGAGNEEYLTSVLEAMNDPTNLIGEEPLSLAFIYSSRDDMNWLLNKQRAIYFSKPPNEIYPKELALSDFMNLVISVDSAYNFEIGDSNFMQEEEKALAIQSDGASLGLASESDLNEVFDNFAERKAYLNYLESLFDEFITLKKNSIISSTDANFRYAEAKKINWMVAPAPAE